MSPEVQPPIFGLCAVRLGAPQAASRLCLASCLLALPTAGSFPWVAAKPGLYGRGQEGAGGAVDKYQRPHNPAACGELGRLWGFFLSCTCLASASSACSSASEMRSAAQGASEHLKTQGKGGRSATGSKFDHHMSCIVLWGSRAVLPVLTVGPPCPVLLHRGSYQQGEGQQHGGSQSRGVFWEDALGSWVSCAGSRGEVPGKRWPVGLLPKAFHLHWPSQVGAESQPGGEHLHTEMGKCSCG